MGRGQIVEQLGRADIEHGSVVAAVVDIDLVTPDAKAPTTTDAEIRRWWQSAFDTRVAEFPIS